MTKSLHLGAGLDLPLSFATEGVVAIGMRGSGKSNTLVRWAELLYAARIPFVAIDPKGDWGGIRSSADGTALTAAGVTVATPSDIDPTTAGLQQAVFERLNGPDQGSLPARGRTYWPFRPAVTPSPPKGLTMDRQLCPGVGRDAARTAGGQLVCPECHQPIPPDLDPTLPLPAHGPYEGSEQEERQLAAAVTDLISDGPIGTP